jgi:uncharacterized membrane protein
MGRARYKDAHILGGESMIRTHRTLIQAASILLAVLIGASLAHTRTQALGLTAVLWLTLLFPITGSMLLSIITPKTRYRPAAWVVYTTGLGLTACITIGLLLNTAGLLFTFRALDPTIILTTVSICITLLTIGWYWRVRRHPNTHLFPETTPYQHKWRLVCLIFLPLLMAAGAFRLNNGGGSGLATAALGIVCGYTILSAILSKNRHPWWYVAHIVNIGVALGLSVALRSNHIFGFDINQEFQIFNATLQQGIWQPRLFDGAYNACLSITILPTMLSAFIPVSGEYIFKFVMQLLLGIIPLVAFIIAARHFRANKQLAYITALFFIVQAQFIFQFPGLIRQQVALLFFGLLMVTLTSSQFGERLRHSLALIFGLAMVVSHYSTAYICIAILACILLVRPILRAVHGRIIQKRHIQAERGRLQYSPFLIVILLLATFLWYGQLMQATGGIVEKVTASVTNLHNAFKEDTRSDFLIGALGLRNKAHDPKNLQAVYQQQSKPYAYQPQPDEYQPEVQASTEPVRVNRTQDALFIFTHKIISLGISLLLLIGLIATVVVYLFRGHRPDEALIGIACGSVFILILTLPGLAQAYNVDRLYQQILLLIGPGIVYAIVLIGKRLRPNIVAPATIAALLVCMTSSTGLIDQVTFRFSNVNLINDGSMYDHHYVRDAEVAAFMWTNGAIGNATLYVDRYSLLPATAFTTHNKSQLQQGVLPSEIDKQAYVYGSSANIHKLLAFGYYNNRVYTFNFPDAYLSDNKNVIYSNNQSRVYR